MLVFRGKLTSIFGWYWQHLPENASPRPITWLCWLDKAVAEVCWSVLKFRSLPVLSCRLPAGPIWSRVVLAGHLDVDASMLLVNWGYQSWWTLTEKVMCNCVALQLNWFARSEGVHLYARLSNLCSIEYFFIMHRCIDWKPLSQFSR